MISVFLQRAATAAVITIGVMTTSPLQADDATARMYLFAAEEALAAKDYSGALSAVRSAERELGSSNALLKSLEVKILFEQGEYTRAKKALDAFMRFNPNDKLTRQMAPYLVKIDKKMKTASEWQVSFENRGRNMITGAMHGKDQSLAVTGWSSEEDSQGGVIFKGWMVAVDQNGNQKLRKNFDQRGLVLRGIAESDSGGYMVGGDMRMDSSGTHRKAWIAIVDGNGNEIASRFYEKDGQSSQINHIVQVESGYLLIGTLNTPGDRSENKVWVEKVGPLGETLGTTVIDSHGDHSILHAALDEDGGVLLAGRRSKEGWLAKLDANGKREWHTGHSANTYTMFEAISPTGTGRYIAAGRIGTDDSVLNGGAYIAVFDRFANPIKQKALPGTYVGDALEAEDGLVPLKVVTYNADTFSATANLTFVDDTGEVVSTLYLPDGSSSALVRTKDGGFMSAEYSFKVARGDEPDTDIEFKKRFLD